MEMFEPAMEKTLRTMKREYYTAAFPLAMDWNKNRQKKDCGHRVFHQQTSTHFFPLRQISSITNKQPDGERKCTAISILLNTLQTTNIINTEHFVQTHTKCTRQIPSSFLGCIAPTLPLLFRVAHSQINMRPHQSVHRLSVHGGNLHFCLCHQCARHK